MMGNWCTRRHQRTRDFQEPLSSGQVLNRSCTSSTITKAESDSTHNNVNHPAINGENSIEYTTILACRDKLVMALSADPVGIAGILLANSFIPSEVSAKMLLLSFTPCEKATILIETVCNNIKVSPERFHDLVRILSEQTWTKDIVKILQQGNYHQDTYL